MRAETDAQRHNPVAEPEMPRALPLMVKPRKCKTDDNMIDWENDGRGQRREDKYVSRSIDVIAI